MAGPDRFRSGRGRMVGGRGADLAEEDGVAEGLHDEGRPVAVDGDAGHALHRAMEDPARPEIDRPPHNVTYMSHNASPAARWGVDESGCVWIWG
jgi:hypothetical protein